MYKLVEKPLSEVLGLAVDASLTVPVREYDETINGVSYVLAHIPKKEPYLFRSDMVRDVLAWLRDENPEPLLIHGPTGTGKTSFVKQLAARLRIPVWESTGNEEMELFEFFGQFLLNEKGATVFLDGPATQAAKFGGWHLINEMDRMRPGVTVGLNGYMEGGTFTLSNKGGEVVTPRPGSAVIATANTNFVGDETNGNYSTAHIHDKSVVERFGMIIKADYLDDDQERALLALEYQDITDDDLQYWFDAEGMEIARDDGTTARGQYISRDDYINTMLKFRKTVRDQSVESGNTAGNAFERTMSTRTLLRWAKHTVRFSNAPDKGLSALHYALERALSNGCTATSKVALHQLLKDYFGVAAVL